MTVTPIRAGNEQDDPFPEPAGPVGERIGARRGSDVCAHRLGRTGGGRFPAVQQYAEPSRRRRRLQGRRGLDDGRLVEPVRAQLRDPAQGQPDCPILLYLCHRLRSRRGMDGTGLHVHPRQGVHHPRHRRLPGARVRSHRLLRSGYRRAARLDRPAHRIERTDAAASIAARQSAHPAAERRAGGTAARTTPPKNPIR